MRNKILNVILGILCVTIAIPSLAYASEGERLYTETVTYKSDNPDEKNSFEETIKRNGRTYRLKDVQYEVISEEYKKVEGEITHLEKSGIVTLESESQFAESIEVDGITYHLKEIQEVESEAYVQEVTANTDYEYVVTKSDVPQVKTISVKNEKTGQEEIVECTFSDVQQIGTKWVDSYINIRFKDYGSTAFSWQNQYFANDPESAPLARYETQLLESVGLTEKTGKVLKTYWTSEAYTEDGVMYRDAKADITKEVPVYRASYSGKLTTPMVIREAVYAGQGMVDSDEIEYTIEATAEYEESVILQLGVFILLIIILIVIILVILSKKRKRESHKQGE